MRLTREKERFNKECRNRGKRLTRHKMDTFCNNLPNKCSIKKEKQELMTLANQAIQKLRKFFYVLIDGGREERAKKVDESFFIEKKFRG